MGGIHLLSSKTSLLYVLGLVQVFKSRAVCLILIGRGVRCSFHPIARPCPLTGPTPRKDHCRPVKALRARTTCPAAYVRSNSIRSRLDCTTPILEHLLPITSPTPPSINTGTTLLSPIVEDIPAKDSVTDP
ncbi:hypothetical protein V8F33_008378 [Rhypophila sp. PSN 637]